jgi:phosphocarrier protein HPr
MAELRRSALICNQRGLHARAAAKFVKVAAAFTSEIDVRKGDQSVSGQSIMGLMMLAAGIGSTVEITVNGDDAEAAMDAVLDLIGRKFDEE